MTYQIMLARLGDKALFERKNPIGFIFEPKLDGTRVLVYKDGNDIQLINRRGHDITYRYPEMLDISRWIRTRSCVLDTELIVLDKKGKPNFNLLQQREQPDKKIVIDLRSKQFPATLFVFDILEKNGIPLIEKLLRERKQELEKIIMNGQFIALCPSALNGKVLWNQVIKQKMEGIMAKDLNSKYGQGKRSWAWLKIKNFNTIDAIIVGFTKGSAARARYFGALIVGAYKQDELVYVGRVRTGFDKKILKQLTKMMKKLIIKEPAISKEEQKKVYESRAAQAAHEIQVTWLKPELVAKIKYLELTKALELRTPRFMRLRFDKNPQECALES